MSDHVRVSLLAEIVLVGIQHLDRPDDPHTDLVAHHQVDESAPIDEDDLGLTATLDKLLR